MVITNRILFCLKRALSDCCCTVFYISACTLLILFIVFEKIMGRPKGKRGRKAAVVDQVAETKVLKIKELIDLLRSSKTRFEQQLNLLCVQKCQEIDQTYKNHLSSIPCNIQNMTIEEAIEFQEKEKIKERSTECQGTDLLRSNFERTKAFSEKKKTLRKERKRSISVNTATKTFSNKKHLPLNRAVSNDSLLNTPGKFNRLPSLAVTPKFDPSKPMLKLARKPKPGEVLMSISGSPVKLIQNYGNENKVTLSFGQGRVLTLGDENGIDPDLSQEFDAPMKETLKNIKEKLDQILKS